MTKAPSKSEPHQRTRRDHATETAEDYVEAVADILDAHETCRVTDLAKRFAVSHVTVNRIVGRLANEGLLVTEPYQPITMTSKGQASCSPLSGMPRDRVPLPAGDRNRRGHSRH